MPYLGHLGRFLLVLGMKSSLEKGIFHETLPDIPIFHAMTENHLIAIMERLGCATGNFAGGQLMQYFGILAILISGVVIAAAGTLVLLLTLERKDAWLIQHTAS